ncbi:amiloride-sensitive sodium channel subunit alpha-like [Stylophora pistillata]|uniref:amiloride-sensitive sodium channel subunit alpha-like n=1 Tax=Stylophora pistillata TaxID=50429 RepID=UPI000C0397B3|nr:amiloride-sensitive sodium channel subunit alpha-like [Stylophora pistillata]
MGKEASEISREKDTKTKKPSIKEVISNFCGYTTAHGLGRLADGGGIFRRVSWTLFCVGAMAMFIVQTKNLFVIYFSRPVTTVVTVNHESHVKFPAVSICNLNMIRYDKLPYGFIDGILEHLRIEGENESGDSRTSHDTFSTGGVPPDLPNDTAGVFTDSLEDPTTGSLQGSTHTSDVSDVVTQSIATESPTAPPGDPTDASTSVPGGPIATTDVHTGFPGVPTLYPSDDNNYDYNNEYDPDYFYDYDYFGSDYFYLGGPEESKEEEYRIEETIRAELAMKNDSETYSMGHQFEDLVFECSFRGYDCRNYSRYWRHFWDHRYGNCFTFNGGTDDDGEGQKVMISHITGPAGGLKLNLFIEQSQYIAELSDTAGARVVIHDQGQIPFPNNEGYNVLPSRSTSFGLTRKVIERVDPFGNGSCQSEKSLNRNNMYAKKFNVSYSRQACLDSCQAEKQVEECGCASGQFPSHSDICNLKNSTTVMSGSVVLSQVFEIQFMATLSMAQYPAYYFEAILESRVKEKTTIYKELYNGFNLNENFAQVKIFYEQLNYQKVSERISYKGVNLVADIGGQLGLWIGISVLTCCEFLELVIILTQTVIGRMRRRKLIHIQP